MTSLITINYCGIEYDYFNSKLKILISIPKENFMLKTYYIYEITNNLDGRNYIGQRFCPDNKTPWTDTRYMGKGIYLQASQKKHGIENFSKRILAICYDETILNILEVEYIKAYKEIGKAEYNIASGGHDRPRMYMTEEQKKLYNKHISEALQKSEKHKQSFHSEERNRKISIANKGRPSPTKGFKYPEEHCQKISQAVNDMYNSPKGEEVKSKIREARKHQIVTEEHRKHISEGLRGRTITEEHRKHLSESQKGRTISEETKAKIRAARQKQVITQESIEKRKVSIAEYWASEKGQQQKRLNSEFMKTFCPKPTLGKRWYTNGTEDVLADECPEGFTPGRCKTQVPCSEETKQKKRDWWINLSEEEKKTHLEKVSSGLKGHGCSDTRRSNISKANKGRHYYNNGVIEVMQFECPEGFVPGRLPSMAAKISKNLKRK